MTEQHDVLNLRPYHPADELRGHLNGYDADAADSLGVPAAPKKFELIPFRNIVFAAGSRWLVKGLLASTGLATDLRAAEAIQELRRGRRSAAHRERHALGRAARATGCRGLCGRGGPDRFLRSHRGQPPGYPDELPFFLVKARPNLGSAEGDRAALIASIEAVITPLKMRLAAVFIDTLVRTLAGASENDEGMRNFTDNAEAIADHFDCLAVAVHHTGKDTAKGMRGSSALHGAVVTSWRVEKARPFQARITLEDAKDGESGLTWTADLEKFVHGHDEDGDEASVLIVSTVSEPVREGEIVLPPATDLPKRRATMPAQLTLFMACLDTAMASQSRDARPFTDGPVIRVVSLDAVRSEYLARRGDDAKDEAKRKAFSYSQKAALDRRLILIEEIDGQKVAWRAKANT